MYLVICWSILCARSLFVSFLTFLNSFSTAREACYLNSQVIGNGSWYVIVSFSFSYKPFDISAYLFAVLFNSTAESACSENSGNTNIIGNGSWCVIVSFSFSYKSFDFMLTIPLRFFVQQHR